MLSDLNWAFFSGFTYSALRVFALAVNFVWGLLSAAAVMFSVVLFCPLTSDLRPTCIVDSLKIIKPNSQNQSFDFVLLSHNVRDMKQESETLILH